MAETLAIIASIFQLVDFGSKVVSRLNEFHANLEDDKSAFHQIRLEVPLLLDILGQTKETINAGQLRPETVKVLFPVIEKCRGQIELLDDILVKILPTYTDSRAKRSIKALSSLVKDDKIKRISLSIQSCIRTLTFFYAADSSTMKPMTGKMLDEIRRWLSPPDPSLNYQKALKQHLQNTGLWLLESEQYKSWKASNASFLWLHGIPGCGKTILSSAVIQDILQDCREDPTKAIIYYYFTFNDTQKQTTELMVKSLLVQLTQYCVKIPTALQTLFSLKSDGQQQPSVDELLQVLRALAQDFSDVYMVLDALDECNDRIELLPIVETMAGWQFKGLHMIVTSRIEADIQATVAPLVQADGVVSLQSKLVDKDISRYVRHRIANDKNLQRWRKHPEVQQEIEKVLMEKACGMYGPTIIAYMSSADNSGYINRWRWATCQLDTLGKCLNRSMLQKSLLDLPRTLDETYDRILCAIDHDYRGYALSILQWLCFSARPLKIGEIAEIVAINLEGTPTFDKDQVLADPADILQICSSLVTLVTRAHDEKVWESFDNKDSESSKYRISPLSTDTTSEADQQYLALGHYSVKEYLISERIRQSSAAEFSIQERVANRFIAEGCLVYLLRFQEPVCLLESDLYVYKLADYAARFWVKHTHAAQQDGGLLYQLIKKLFTSTDGAYVNWLRIYHPERSREGFYPLETTETVLSPLYCASLYGLVETARLLIEEESADINAQDGEKGNALQVASCYGHTNMVELLIEAKAKVNAQGGYYGSALQAASMSGHDSAVEQLLKAGANVNAQGGYYGNALQAASMSGYNSLVEQLLRAGADINAQGGYYGNALQAASMSGHNSLVEQLLRAGADINAQGGYHGNALQAASMFGHNSTVKQLLKAGADINAQGGYYSNALQAASADGHDSIVELLLRAGADINAQGGDHGSALQAASTSGQDSTVERLLRAGADINAQGGYHGSALQAASAVGHDSTVEQLLKAGADINAQGGLYGNALQAASANGYDSIVEQLLRAGADINAQGGEYGSALQAASISGYDSTAEQLLRAGADINAQGGYHGSALQAASMSDKNNTVEQLLRVGADINAQGGLYGNALQATLMFGKDSTVEQLLRAGADINAQGGYYGNALQAASVFSNDSIVEQLLRAGADINAQGGYYGNALQAASAGDHDSILELLLRAGANINAQGGYYGNALQAASAVGHNSAVKLLLKAGADINAQGGYYGNALQAASTSGHNSIVEQLLKAGADINAQGDYYGNALQVASIFGHNSAVEQLLRAGADINAQWGDYGNALQAASMSGNDSTVELLLKAGADINAQGGLYGNALQAASYHGSVKIAELLLEAGANVNAQGGKYCTALQAASEGGYEKVVELLLEAGADLDAQGDDALRKTFPFSYSHILERLGRSDVESVEPK